jgi:mono/diheme cytochrome c family protein
VTQAPAFPSSRGRTLRVLGLALVVAVTASACRQDMHDAAKYEPLEKSAFFKDGRASRQLVPGTIARGKLKEDTLLHTGRDANGLAATFPFPVTAGVLARGQERYNIYCSPCHSQVGDGNGMIAQRGFKRPPTFHDDRVRGMAPGYFVNVMTNGFATMPSYALQVSPEDRWAITAYIKALQLSQHASASNLSAEDRAKVEKGEVETEAGSGSGHAPAQGGHEPAHGKEAHGG